MLFIQAESRSIQRLVVQKKPAGPLASHNPAAISVNRYEAHFVSKLSDSDAGQAETQHWLDTSRACGYISAEKHQTLFEKCMEIGRMLGRMIAKPGSFCRQYGK